jgi:PmbA protein
MFAMKKTLDYALTKASQAEILFDYSKGLSLSSEKEKISKYSVSSTEIMGVRVVRDNRVGISYSECLEEKSLRQMVDDAILNSRFLDEKEYEQITVQGKKYTEDDAHSWFEEDISPEQKVDLALSLESKILDFGGDVKGSPYNGFSEREGGLMVMNHWGTFCSRRFKHYSCYTTALLESTKGEKRSMFSAFDSSYKFSELNVAKLIHEAHYNAKELMKGSAIPSGPRDVIFDVHMLAGLFSRFSGLFSGKGAMEGHNPFRDKLGQKVAHDSLSIQDKPLYQPGMLYSTFDSEGALRSDMNLIEKGILQNFYHNTATAKHFKTKTTAHASRSAKSHLEVAGTQLFIEPGTSSEKDLKSGEYLLIKELAGLHSGTNPISGDFSLACKGYLCRNGEVLQPVSQITVAGNFFQMMHNVVALGDASTLDNSSLAFFAPQIRFSDLQITGS